MNIKNILIPILAVLILAGCNEQPMLFMAGDSTMANKKEKAKPETGWGEALSDFFSDDFVIENHAQNGRSSRSFIYEGRWDSLISKVNKGDFVVIQFGHNDDVVTKIGRHSTLEEYKYNLTRYVNDVKSKQAIPILCTPIQRRNFDSVGVMVNTHGEYPDIVKEVGVETNVPVIDMQYLSDSLVTSMGVEESTKLFMHLAPGEYENYPNGRTDDTHLNEFGAHQVAALFVEKIKQEKLSLSKYLK